MDQISPPFHQLFPAAHVENAPSAKEDLSNGHTTPRALLDLVSVDSPLDTSGTNPNGKYGHNSIDHDWTSSHEQIISGPYNHLLKAPGKGFREHIMNAFNVWINVPTERLEIIMDAVNMLHSASLLIDDIQDNSELRRGLPAAHLVFGVAQTINSANYYYFQAMRRIEMLDSEESKKHFTDELIQLHRGQGMELHWRDHLVCPSEDEYLQMVSNKTAGLFRLSIKMMASQSPEAAAPEWLLLAEVLGLFFQIRDDYQNLNSAEYTAGKGYCEDITEGKFSFPIIHSIHHPNQSGGELLNILRQRPRAIDLKRYAVHCMEETGSFEYTRSVLRILEERGKELIDIIAGNRKDTGVAMHALLQKLAI